MRQKIINSCWLIAAGVALLTAAICNGYPLVYSDTSTYLASGFELETPADRPITYGLFLRFASFNGFSLWIPVLLQSVLLAWLIARLAALLGYQPAYRVSFLAICFCVLTSGVSWVSSQLIADLFTPMLILLWALVLLDKKAPVKRQALYGFLVFFVSSMHMSHFVMSLLFAACALLFMPVRAVRACLDFKKIALIALFSGASFLTFSAAYSKYHNVFLVARLDEAGILKQMLNDKCQQADFCLCAYKDSLPGNAVDFLWKDSSPLKKCGGYSSVKAEFKEIARTCFSESRYRNRFIAAGAKDTWRQFAHFGIGDGNGVFMNGTLLQQRIRKYASGDVDAYEYSLQQQGRLPGFDGINGYFVASSLLILALLLAYIFWAGATPEMITLCLIAVAGILINNFVCAAFSAVSERYGCRVMWLLNLLFVLLVMKNEKLSKLYKKK